MTGNTVVPSMWQDLPQGGPMLMAADTPLAQIARDFGISASCLARWLKVADRDDGRSVAGDADVDELRALRKRTKLLEQENEILRRATAYFARDVLPK